MNIDPHWLEPIVLGAGLWLLRGFFSDIREALKKDIPALKTTVALHDQRHEATEKELGHVRGRLERAFGWTPLPRKVHHNGGGE